MNLLNYQYRQKNTRYLYLDIPKNVEKDFYNNVTTVEWAKEQINSETINGLNLLSYLVENGLSTSKVISLLDDVKNTNWNSNAPKKSALYILAIQSGLKIAGVDINMGKLGMFGSKTKAAILEFQRKWNKSNNSLIIGGKKVKKIIEDGIPGPQSIHALMQYLSSSRAEVIDTEEKENTGKDEKEIELSDEEKNKKISNYFNGRIEEFIPVYEQEMSKRLKFVRSKIDSLKLEYKGFWRFQKNENKEAFIKQFECIARKKFSLPPNEHHDDYDSEWFPFMAGMTRGDFYSKDDDVNEQYILNLFQSYDANTKNEEFDRRLNDFYDREYDISRNMSDECYSYLAFQNNFKQIKDKSTNTVEYFTEGSTFHKKNIYKQKDFDVLKYLPNYKTNLIIHSKSFNDSCISLIPKHIKNLDLRRTSITGKDFNDLPSQLKKLKVGDIETNYLNSLPNIEELTVGSHLGIFDSLDWQSLPKSLKKMNISIYPETAYPKAKELAKKISVSFEINIIVS